MIEYICNTDDKCGCCDAYKQAERIVRCRDCRYFAKNEKEFESFMRGDMESVCMSEDPDGFCAWGKPKVVK